MLCLRGKIREPIGVVQSYQRFWPCDPQANRGHEYKTEGKERKAIVDIDKFISP